MWRIGWEEQSSCGQDTGQEAGAAAERRGDTKTTAVGVTGMRTINYYLKDNEHKPW